MPLLALLARSASACTVCFGLDKNAAISKALTMGIVLLVVTVLTVLAVIVRWCWKIEQAKIAREKAA
jgi:uncharacterized membrane protein